MPSTSSSNPVSILMKNKKSENDSNQTFLISATLSNFITNQRHADNTDFVQSLIEFISYHAMPNSFHNPLFLASQATAPSSIKQTIPTSNTNRSTSTVDGLSSEGQAMD
ncbi:hypothetical protein WA026_020993 [Henosepilachna vigintioctopunctata]|uniref:Uncharacterized protein n=1 Tax=Henosepilachna vigintioctopunctata TaxID=420089 RepID=A0AAW1VBN8_9CUCU